MVLLFNIDFFCKFNSLVLNLEATFTKFLHPQQGYKEVVYLNAILVGYVNTFITEFPPFNHVVNNQN